MHDFTDDDINLLVDAVSNLCHNARCANCVLANKVSSQRIALCSDEAIFNTPQEVADAMDWPPEVFSPPLFEGASDSDIQSLFEF